MSCCCTPPIATGMEPGWNDFSGGSETVLVPLIPDQYNELINFNLPIDQQVIDIPFSVLKASTNFVTHGLAIENLVDSAVVVPAFSITGRARTGIQITLSGTIDTANYYIRGLVSVVA